jgi:PST family polysaccharide transporter
MSLLAKSARGLKWQAIEIAGRQLLSLFVFTTLARLLDPSAFGLLGLVGVYLGFAALVADQGLGTALVQRKEIEPEHLSAAFWWNVGCAAVLCLATLALSGWFAKFFDEPRLAPLLRWSSLALVINALVAVQGSMFTRAMDFRSVAIRTFVATVAGGVVGVGMALGGCGVWALVGQQLATSVAGACFLWFASPWRPSLVLSWPHLKQLITVSTSVFATGFLWFISSRLDQLVIGRFAGSAVLGQYVVGGRLSEIARVAIQQPLGAVSLPALSQLQQDHQRMCRAIYRGMELNALVSFSVFGGLAAVAPTLVPLAFGAQWEPAASMLQLLAVYNLIVGLLVYCFPALLVSGNLGRFMVVNIGCSVGAATACLVGIRYGVHGVILGLIINISITGLLALLFLRSRIGLDPWKYCQPCLVPGAAGAAMFAAVGLTRTLLSTRTGEWPNLVAQVLAGAVVYTGLVLLMAPASAARLREFAALSLARGAQQPPPPAA